MYQEDDTNEGILDARKTVTHTSADAMIPSDSGLSSWSHPRRTGDDEGMYTTRANLTQADVQVAHTTAFSQSSSSGRYAPFFQQVTPTFFQVVLYFCCIFHVRAWRSSTTKIGKTKRKQVAYFLLPRGVKRRKRRGVLSVVGGRAPWTNAIGSEDEEAHDRARMDLGHTVFANLGADVQVSASCGQIIKRGDATEERSPYVGRQSLT